MKQLLIIKLVVWLGWLSCIALAQLELSGAITGSVSFPHVGITCLGNVAVFITSLLRKRLDLEMGARDLLATITAPCKLREIPDESREDESKEDDLIGFRTSEGYKEASVVMLTSSAGMTSSSIRHFMKYIYNAHDVKSILLKSIHPTNTKDHVCKCIVFPNEKAITTKLAGHMPRALVKLSDTKCLLPSLQCRRKGCHECNQNLLHVEETLDVDNFNVETLVVDNFNVEFPDAVCDALDFEFTAPFHEAPEPICICIPLNPVSADSWTKLLVRSFKSKDQQDKGAIVMSSDALQSYLDERREDRQEEVIYRTASLIVVRIVEISINLLLTLWFKVDGFSSSLAARRAVRSYVVDSKGNGLPADVFLTSALVVVKSDSVCQVLKFRGADKWYEISSEPPSKPRVAVIIAAIVIVFGMDLFDFFLSGMKGSKDLMTSLEDLESSKGSMTSLEDLESSKDSKDVIEKVIENVSEKIKKVIGNISEKIKKKKWRMVLAVMILEIIFAVLVGTLGLNKGIGRWVYGALQVLVWVKWGIGSYLLHEYSPEYVPTRAERVTDEYGNVSLPHSSARWVDEGTLVYSSSFFLNAVLAGVRGNWAGAWSNWK